MEGKGEEHPAQSDDVVCILAVIKAIVGQRAQQVQLNLKKHFSILFLFFYYIFFYLYFFSSSLVSMTKGVPWARKKQREGVKGNCFPSGLNVGPKIWPMKYLFLRLFVQLTLLALLRLSDDTPGQQVLVVRVRQHGPLGANVPVHQNGPNLGLRTHNLMHSLNKWRGDPEHNI